MAAARLRAGDRWDDTEWIFSMATGTYVNPRNLARAYRQARKGANLRPQPLHARGRHIVSAQIAQGVPWS
jgi:hypothetical protein